MIKIVDYNAIMNDRKLFNETVYTPLSEAIRILDERQKDKELLGKVEKILKGDIPEFFKNKKCGVLSRSLATPNNESSRFLSFFDMMDDFSPVFWEYHDDKFTPNMNEVKYNLAKMTFHSGIGHKGGEKIKKLRIVDFNFYEGKKISQVKTLWDQKLTDFHHELFKEVYSESLLKKIIFYDASMWYVKLGGSVEIYYKYIFTLFITHSILFENFMLDNQEESLFIKKIFLPAFFKVIEETGQKPLIVPLEPIETEGLEFLMSYKGSLIDFVESKLNLI